MQSNVDLTPFNTLALPAIAERFIEAQSDDELQEVASWLSQEAVVPLILGEGSNLVFRSRQVADCIHIRSHGIRVLQECERTVEIEVAAGEHWNSVVEHTLQQGYYGLENLALIPGSTGASPVQNIGAYGVELSQFVTAVKYYDIETARAHWLSNDGCEFSYRSSIFKKALKQKALIAAVRLRLSKVPRVNTAYRALREELAGTDSPNPFQVKEAVVRIRQRKLPDPAEIANAGSFFKNPEVNEEEFARLEKEYPEIVAFPTGQHGNRKLAAAWLLDNAGWKGFSNGKVGFHNDQALVLVNHGAAFGDDVLSLAEQAIASIQARFGVVLEIEPAVI